jgi:hypothetical protein
MRQTRLTGLQKQQALRTGPEIVADIPIRSEMVGDAKVSQRFENVADKTNRFAK